MNPGGWAAPLALIAGSWREPPVFLVLALNLIPAVFALLFGWSAGELFAVYLVENLVIGVFNALKMAISGAAMGVGGAVIAVFFVPFFIFHYGLFCFGHGVFTWVFLAMDGPRGLEGVRMPDTIGQALAALPDPRGFALGVASIVGMHLANFTTDWLRFRRWRDTNPISQMMEPYGRIFVLHITLIATGFLLVFADGPRFGVVVLALLKTAYDGWDEARRQRNAKEMAAAA